MWMQCERKLGDGKKLIIIAEAFVKKDQPSVSVGIESEGKVTTILEGIPADINELVDWLQGRADEARAVHKLQHVGWKER